MAKRPHRRYSTAFKLQLAESYLNGEGSLRTIAKKHGIAHSPTRKDSSVGRWRRWWASF